jgi:hypothetical protein
MNRLRTFAITLALALAASTLHASAVTSLSYHGGPIMQANKAELIFWLPPGSHFLLAPSDNASSDAAYESTIETFFKNLSGTSYLGITTQYPGKCSTNACTAPGNPGAISIANIITDPDPYPSSPLQDGDIHTELQNLITQRSLPVDGNTEFFVFIAGTQQACNSPFGGCSGTDFCAYHSSNDFNGNTIVYALMPVASEAGCGEGIGGTGPAVIGNRELVALSHELFESITDPDTFFSSINFPDVLPFGRTAWWDSTNVFGTNYGNEIGDECNQQAASVMLNSAGPLFVQNQWSNDTNTCVSAFGPSVRFDITTGGDDLRGDSSASAALSVIGGAVQTVTLKSQSNPSWDNNTTHEVVAGLSPAQLPSQASPLSGLGITLTSHNSFLETDDNWNINNVTMSVLAPTGQVVCTMSNGGTPLARLTGSARTLNLVVPNCPTMVSSNPTFNQIRFVIVTGGDDLRSDSEATAAIQAPGGALLQLIHLKNQNDSHSWDNNTTHDLTFNLNSPMAFSALGNILITLTSHNSFLETDDNWNIQSANITLSNNGAGARCYSNVAGNPFARLTGSQPSVTISPGQNC